MNASLDTKPEQPGLTGREGVMGVFNRIRSEVQCVSSALRTVAAVKPVAENPDRTLSDLVDRIAAKYADRPALVAETEQLTYRGYNARAYQYARWAMAHGVGKGDAVALMMPNRPDYLAVWLGIARAGGVTALLNTNLRGKALAHCINIAQVKHIIVDATLLDAFATTDGMVDGTPVLHCHGGSPIGWRRIDEAVAEFSDAPIAPEDRPKLTVNDRCLFIYTSGTTGMPKAANINHYRVQTIMLGFRAAMNMKASDRIYACLPFYHTSGGVIATGSALMAGGTVIIRDKFSARQFWDDIVRYDCTVFQYIGELCRYLVNSPPDPNETKHRIRLASGNGLRPDIWNAFRTRFRIPKILEWYAATESNAVLFNFDGTEGSLGRIPRWAAKRFAIEVVRFDIDTEQPVRGADGSCIKCAADEPGEVISQILNDPERPSQRFEGYADPAATEKKILRDVFAKGDRWFRTGDLMRKDALGYFYFLDRTGDTFRWKGENVATSEVAEALTGFDAIKEANVYGVGVPGAEGRAGMAALVVDGALDLPAFSRYVAERLPAYSRPVFLRVTPEIEATSTFKQRKLDLVKEGFDPAAIADPIYFLDPTTQAYGRVDPALHARICGGKVKL